LRVTFPPELEFLSEPHRYKVLYGGRGGIKSWSVAQHLLIAGVERPLRIPCARETMQSIRESVHQLLEDQISRLGYQRHYEVQKAEIIGRNGTSFTFHGLRDQSVHNIKSLEGADILWVEEAQNVSKKSWRTVIPTIRKPGSEIWVSFNPELETDDTYQRFVVHPPPGAVVVKTSYRDNEYLSEELMAEIEHLKATDPDEYEHVYEGMCRQAVTGAVYKNELLAADKEGRICRVPYDASKPVDTFWDLGYFR
jgi:phage terminase large subunit